RFGRQKFDESLVARRAALNVRVVAERSEVQTGTMSEYRITQARPPDLRSLASIEIAAARLLRGHAPADVLNETTSEDELDDARRPGQLWVALAGDAPVA